MDAAAVGVHRCIPQVRSIGPMQRGHEIVHLGDETWAWGAGFVGSRAALGMASTWDVSIDGLRMVGAAWSRQ